MVLVLNALLWRIRPQPHVSVFDESSYLSRRRKCVDDIGVFDKTSISSG